MGGPVRGHCSLYQELPRRVNTDHPPLLHPPALPSLLCQIHLFRPATCPARRERTYSKYEWGEWAGTGRFALQGEAPLLQEVKWPRVAGMVDSEISSEGRGREVRTFLCLIPQDSTPCAAVPQLRAGWTGQGRSGGGGAWGLSCLFHFPSVDLLENRARDLGKPWP